MIDLEPYDPLDIAPEPPPALTVVYLVRRDRSRLAWLCCFGDFAVVWWLPDDLPPYVLPNFRNPGWSIASPYPEAPFWFVSSRFSDALDYLYNGLRSHDPR